MAAVTAAVVGIASAGASTYMSFSNAAKQKRAQEEADREAKKAMKDARSRAEKDYFEVWEVEVMGLPGFYYILNKLENVL